jgi:hypothetical protein
LKLGILSHSKTLENCKRLSLFPKIIRLMVEFTFRDSDAAAQTGKRGEDAVGAGARHQVGSESFPSILPSEIGSFFPALCLVHWQAVSFSLCQMDGERRSLLP